MPDAALRTGRRPGTEARPGEQGLVWVGVQVGKRTAQTLGGASGAFRVSQAQGGWGRRAPRGSPGPSLSSELPASQGSQEHPLRVGLISLIPPPPTHPQQGYHDPHCSGKETEAWRGERASEPQKQEGAGLGRGCWGWVGRAGELHAL